MNVPGLGSISGVYIEFIPIKRHTPEGAIHLQWAHDILKTERGKVFFFLQLLDRKGKARYI
jgi:hypothetical protein